LASLLIEGEFILASDFAGTFGALRFLVYDAKLT